MEINPPFSQFQNNKSCQKGDIYKNVFVWFVETVDIDILVHREIVTEKSCNLSE